MEAAGFANVATVTASGNVLFDGDPASQSEYAARIAQVIADRFGIATFAVVVTRDDIVAPGMDTVSNDDVAGARLAIDHLVGLGHARIVYLSGGDNPVSHLRATGYAAAMTAHGLAELIRIVPGGLTDAIGYRAAEAALEFNPTALFVANDIAAFGAIAAIENANLRVPEDISVIGYDGIRIGGMRRVNLTTIAQPLAELGRRAAQHMLRRISDRDSPAQHENVSASLVIRGTTGPVKSTN
jgi:DNA-binding LacI/PurR family transcriptional regulator